jgi:hypothetical protein
MAKKKSYRKFAREYFKNELYEIKNMMDETELSAKACIDVLYDYKEHVFGEYVAVRIYPKNVNA